VTFLAAVVFLPVDFFAVAFFAGGFFVAAFFAAFFAGFFFVAIANLLSDCAHVGLMMRLDYAHNMLGVKRVYASISGMSWKSPEIGFAKRRCVDVARRDAR
jgi:hypothetical protein